MDINYDAWKEGFYEKIGPYAEEIFEDEEGDFDKNFDLEMGYNTSNLDHKAIEHVMKIIEENANGTKMDTWELEGRKISSPDLQ